MVDMDENKIQMISRMLEIGGTMLAQHCDCCGAPMFRYKGDVFCPVCKEVEDPRMKFQSGSSPESSPATKAVGIPVTEHIVPHAVSHAAPARENAHETPSVSVGSKKAPAPQDETTGSELESLLMQKLVSIARSMQDETDVRRISDAMDILERGISVIEGMRKIL